MKNFDHITVTFQEYIDSALISYSFGNGRFGTHAVGLSEECIVNFIKSPIFLVRNDSNKNAFRYDHISIEDNAEDVQHIVKELNKIMQK